MKTTNTSLLLIPLMSLGIMTLPGLVTLRAQDQGTSTNAPSHGPCHNWHHHDGEGFANLTDAERQELKADMQKIENDPQLQAAKDAVKQAEDSLRQLRRQLLLQVDPSVQAILDKLHEEKAPGAPGA